MSGTNPADPPGEVSTPTPLAAAEGSSAPSLRTNSAARLAADLATLLLSLAAATITARVLGPEGKGYYSSLILLAGLFVQVFAAGLGEAAIVLSGRGRTTLAIAASATAFATVLLSAAGSLIFLVVANAVLDPPKDTVAPLVGALFVAVTIWYTTAVSFLLAQEQIVAVAALAVLAAALSTVSLWGSLVVLGLGAAGAVASSVLGSSVAVLATFVLLHRGRLSLRPRWRSGYLAAAFRFGTAVQFSNLLVMLTARVDLVLVYQLNTPAEAGSYSVALTVGALVSSIPIALAYASFPRLAVLPDNEARTLTAHVFRGGLIAALATGLLLAAVSPVVVPLMFGDDYRSAVVPTLLVIPGGMLWSAQWLLSRAAAARGNATALLVSFAASFATMLGLDLALIGRYGGRGAAIASFAAAGLGVIVSWLACRRVGWKLGDFVPRPADVRYLVTSVAGLLSHVRR